MNVPMSRQASRGAGPAPAVRAPRILMSWEDWLTFIAAFIAFIAVAVSIQQAEWVRDFPPLVPTAICALLIGMLAARVRAPSAIVHPVALGLGAVVVVLAVQGYADGDTLGQRLHDFQARMYEWFEVVRANDISNDNLPFVTLVHSVSFLAIYIGSYVIYRWHNPWVALLPAAIVLLANISFQDGQPAGPFIVFLFGALLLIARLYLQQNQVKWRKAGIEYPDFISLNAVQLTVFVAIGLMVLAWAVPLGTQQKAFESIYDRVIQPFTTDSDRLVRLFSNIDSRKGANLHELGNTLPIQGSVQLGTKNVLQVKAPGAGFLRGASYEEYTGAGWVAGDRDRERVDGQRIAATADVAEYEKRNAVTIEVTVLDQANVVLSPGMPIGSNRDVTIETPKDVRGEIEVMRLRRGLDEGETYTAIGSQSVATAEDLRGAGTEYPDWVRERYLQLPDDLPGRVAEEARRVAGNASTPYDQALAIEEYLRGFPYNLDVEAAPPNQDVVDFFLFELKQGYFDYHATAMAVMLRTLGIPARIAVGYALDPEQEQDGTFTVKKNDAYSWVEVWFPRYGWVEFNPTPDRPAGGAGGGSLIDPVTGEGPGVDLGDLFAQDFIDPNLLPEALPPEIGQALTQEPVDKSSPPWTLIWTLTALLTAAAVLVIASQVAWNWGLGGLDERAKLWAKAHRVASWAGLAGRPEETPREWARRVGVAVAKEQEASRLADAYEEAIYGRPDLQRIEDEEAEAAYKEVRNTLFARIFGRKGEKKAERTSVRKRR